MEPSSPTTTTVTSAFTTTEVVQGVPEEQYNLVKQRLKEMTEKNQVLTNDLNHAKKRLRRLTHEKTVLLDKLCKEDETTSLGDIADESMMNNESNENYHVSPLLDNTQYRSPCTSTKKDLHLLTDDESQQLQKSHHQSTPSLSDKLHSQPYDLHPKEIININTQEKPPDIHQLQTSSAMRKELSSLPTLPSTILHHQIPSTLTSTNSTVFASCADYNDSTSSTPMDICPVGPSPTVLSLSTPSLLNDTTNRNITPQHYDSNHSSNTNTNHYQQHHHRPLFQYHHRRQYLHHHSPMDSSRNCTMVPSSRPKRMRRGNQEPKMRRVQPLPRDPSSGEYTLPAHVGILTVHSLGRVVPLTTYHNDRYIWPPGFKVSRTYLSMINSDQNTVYTCTVEENGEQGPRFRVIAEDCPDQPIIANSATGVWTAIVKRANEIRNREHSNSASGPDYYGFTHATIAKMIQDLPGADQCLNYVWQKFGVMHQRTAAGVAAAAQKKLTNLEIMGSANKRAPPPAGEGFMLNKDDSSGTTAITNNNSNNDSKKINGKDESALEAPYISPPLSHTSTQASSATAPVTTTPVPVLPHHPQLCQPPSSSVLPSLAIMTSTAAAAAAAVDIQQDEILNKTQPSSTLSSSIQGIHSTSLQHHSLYHPPNSSDISVWPALSR
ncbi:F/Y rich C-terminus-domain-containing protein [Chlamydoabsidia padenii]|nr:F/Y rich C-terminus-domain-containing protein [Chlamydoabsidia padenii]